jgi:hypothetical protein
MGAAMVSYEKKISHNIGHQVAPYLERISFDNPALFPLSSFK